MKISSYLESQRAKRERFEYDKARLLVSLRYKPRNWHYTAYHTSKKCWIYDLENDVERMNIWMGNNTWGLHFYVEGRRYGGVMAFFSKLTWRNEVYKAGLTALNNPWVKRRDVEVSDESL